MVQRRKTKKIDENIKYALTALKRSLNITFQEIIDAMYDLEEIEDDEDSDHDAVRKISKILSETCSGVNEAREVLSQVSNTLDNFEPDEEFLLTNSLLEICKAYDIDSECLESIAQELADSGEDELVEAIDQALDNGILATDIEKILDSVLSAREKEENRSSKKR